MPTSSLSVVSLLCAALAVCGCAQEQSASSAPAKAGPATPATTAHHAAATMDHGGMDHGMDHGGMDHGSMSAAEMDMMKVPYSKPPLLTTPAALVGASLPAIPLEGTEGEASKLSVVDAKPTVLLLWSTWCTACLHEAKEINRWAKSRDDVRVLAVNVNGITGEKPDVAKVRSYANDLGLTGPIWITAADNLSSMGVRTCPTTFVVDTKGVVRAAREGYNGAGEMNQWLDTHLKTL